MYSLELPTRVGNSNEYIQRKLFSKRSKAFLIYPYLPPDAMKTLSGSGAKVTGRGY